MSFYIIIMQIYLKIANERSWKGNFAYDLCFFYIHNRCFLHCCSCSFCIVLYTIVLNLGVWKKSLMLTKAAFIWSKIQHQIPPKNVSNTNTTLEHKPSLKSLGYICSNGQKYTVWVKIINFSFMPKILRMFSKDHVPWRYFVNFLL